MSNECGDGGDTPVTESEPLAELQEVIDYQFRDRALLERAITHSSAAAENDLPNNQTLEFLGDAVLGLAVSDLTMKAYPDWEEGELTRMRAALVNARGLAAISARLGLGRWLLLGKGEENTGGREKEKILADTYEAILGAVFLDGGFSAGLRFVECHFAELIERADEVMSDYKTTLQEVTQRRFGTTPTYTVVAVRGPDHARHYEVELAVEGKVVAGGEGGSRKAAEQAAARAAASRLDDVLRDDCED